MFLAAVNNFAEKIQTGQPAAAVSSMLSHLDNLANFEEMQLHATMDHLQLLFSKVLATSFEYLQVLDTVPQVCEVLDQLTETANVMEVWFDDRDTLLVLHREKTRCEQEGRFVSGLSKSVDDFQIDRSRCGGKTRQHHTKKKHGSREKGTFTEPITRCLLHLVANGTSPLEQRNGAAGLAYLSLDRENSAAIISMGGLKVVLSLSLSF